MDNSIQAHQKELCNKLWAMANALRGNMEAYEFKNYILGMIFYYYLSDRTEKYMTNLLKDDNISYEDAWTDEEYKTAVVEEALRDLGFIIEPQFLFRKMVKMVQTAAFPPQWILPALAGKFHAHLQTHMPPTQTPFVQHDESGKSKLHLCFIRCTFAEGCRYEANDATHNESFVIEILFLSQACE